MPFSPFRTNRPRLFHALKPQTFVASGRCARMRYKLFGLYWLKRRATSSMARQSSPDTIVCTAEIIRSCASRNLSIVAICGPPSRGHLPLLGEEATRGPHDRQGRRAQEAEAGGRGERASRPAGAPTVPAPRSVP